MPFEIKIPRLGWSGEEAKFVGWLKKEGEFVKNGDPLFTLEDEKAAQDVESTDSGTLQIIKEPPKPGDVLKVGVVIGFLLGEGEKPQGNGETKTESVVETKPAEVPKPEASVAVPQPEPSTIVAEADGGASTRQTASPRARRRASELGVDLAHVAGSGRTGRIIEADVLKNAQNVPTEGARAASPMRRAIAQRTAASFSTTPHFYLGCEFDATSMLRFREDLLPEIEAVAGVRLTLTDSIIRAQAMALRAHPFANAIWQDNSIITLGSRDVGLVVGVPDGLLIPVLRKADTGDISALAKQRASLVEDARAGRLSADAMKGGASSLSNLGTTRVDDFSAVIAAPQSTMLAVGRAALRPCDFKGHLALRQTMRLRLSVDHRVMDGAPAAEFLGTLVELLENPSRLA